MFLLILVYLLIPIAFTGVLYALGARSRKILAVPVVGFVLFPVVFVAVLYFSRLSIQQGRVLPGLGPILSLVFPAADLYEPLAIVPLESGKTEYELVWDHKYVGRHALAVSIPGKAKGMTAMEPKLTVKMEVLEDEQLIFGGGTGKASLYWGKDHYGSHLAWYRVPRDQPVGISLKGTVTVTSGNLDLFLENYPGASLRVVKVSDE